MRTGLLLLAVAVVGFVAAAGLPWADSESPAMADQGAWFSVRANVTRVADGDSIRVRIGKKSERVRLIGIDAPELGACYAPQATNALRALVLQKQVRLVGDRTQARRDRYRRLLAYVSLPNGTDAGRHQLERGFARLFLTTRPFARQAAYAQAASAAAATGAGLHVACSATRTTVTETIITSTEPIDPPLPIPPPPTLPDD